MKVLIMSDSHRNVEPMIEIASMESPNAIFHLGDVEDDAAELQRNVRGIFIYSVCGNCDRMPAAPERIITKVAGKTIFATHGHRYNVKFGFEGAVNTAMTAGADILLFGHTHRRMYVEKDGLVIINPGAVGTYPHPYGILTVNGDNVTYEAKTLN